MLSSSVAATVLNLAATFALTSRLGIVGPLLGTTLSLAGVMVWRLPLLLERTFEVSAAAIGAAALRPVLVGAPYAGLLWMATQHHVPAGWVGLAVESSGVAAGYFLLWWRFVLDETARLRWRDRAREALRPALRSEPAAA